MGDRLGIPRALSVFYFFKKVSRGQRRPGVRAYRMRVHWGPAIRDGAREIITVISRAKTPDFCNFFAGIEIYGRK